MIGEISLKIFEWLKGKFSRDKPKNLYRWSGFPFFFGRSKSGQNVNEFTAMQNTAVYCCVRVLAESIASLPLHVYEYKHGGKEKAISHPLYFLLHDSPNEEMTSFVFRETTITHLLLWGNAYGQILKNFAGRIIGIYPLLPDRVVVSRNDKGEIEYQYTTFNGENPNIKEGKTVTLKKQDVLHIHGLGFDGLVGYSPIAMARNAIGMSMACEDFGASFFANGARPSGILEHPGIIKDPERLRESWQTTYGGAENTGKVVVLEEGMKYQQISIPPDDAQYLETRKFQIAEIARIFRVPLHLLNDLERATFSNIEHQSLEFVVYSLMPWIVRCEQALNKSLFSPSERGRFFVKFNVDGLLRGDYQSRVEGYVKLIQNGVLSVNDVREMEDLNPISDAEGGNLHLINGNVAKLSQAGAAYEKKAGDKVEK